MAEALHVQAPNAMSALLLRHRLNALNVEATVMPDGERWDVRIRVSGDSVAEEVRRLIEEEGVAPPSDLER